MGEVIVSKSFVSKLLSKIQGIFVIDPVSFSTKKRINFRGLAWLLCGFLAIFCLVVFWLPSPEVRNKNFEEKSAGTSQKIGNFGTQDPAQNPLSQIPPLSFARPKNHAPSGTRRIPSFLLRPKVLGSESIGSRTCRSRRCDSGDTIPSRRGAGCCHGPNTKP